MPETKVTSYRQSGGITAADVHVTGSSAVAPAPSKPAKKWWQAWATWVGVAVAFLASLVALLDYFGIQPWEANAVSDDKISVTSYNQSGGITAGTVNIGAQPRHVTTAYAQVLTKAIPTGSPVAVTAFGPDNEALAFAFEVYNWLKANGYPAVKGPNERYGALPPVMGEQVLQTANGYEVLIGANSQ
jgi:hypothetical protein